MKRYTWITILMALVLTLGCVAQAEILPRYGEGQIGLTSVVLCEQLTLREGPSASSDKIKTLEYGTHVIVMRQSDGWAYCALGDAEDSGTGWVNADYLAIDPEWYRTDSRTPVYAWDDTLAPKVGLLDAGLTLPILARQGDWLIVSLRGAVGWVYDGFGY